MISFKNAISQWEYPINEKMISYSALTRKACKNPSRIFGVVQLSVSEQIFTVYNKYYNVDLKKIGGRWVLDEKKFKIAIIDKIKSIEFINANKNTNLVIHYPEWYAEEIKK